MNDYGNALETLVNKIIQLVDDRNYHYQELSIANNLIDELKNENKKLKTQIQQLKQQKYETDLEEFIQNTDRYELQTVNGRKVEKVYYVGSNIYHVLFVDDSKPTIYGRDGKTLRYPSKFIDMFADDSDLIMLKR